MLLVEVEEVLLPAPVDPFEDAAVVSVLDVELFAEVEFIDPAALPDAEPFNELVVLVDVDAPVLSVDAVVVLEP